MFSQGIAVSNPNWRHRAPCDPATSRRHHRRTSTTMDGASSRRLDPLGECKESLLQQAAKLNINNMQALVHYETTGFERTCKWMCVLTLIVDGTTKVVYRSRTSNTKAGACRDAFEAVANDLNNRKSKAFQDKTRSFEPEHDSVLKIDQALDRLRLPPLVYVLTTKELNNNRLLTTTWSCHADAIPSQDIRSRLAPLKSSAVPSYYCTANSKVAVKVGVAQQVLQQLRLSNNQNEQRRCSPPPPRQPEPRIEFPEMPGLKYGLGSLICSGWTRPQGFTTTN